MEAKYKVLNIVKQPLMKTDGSWGNGFVVTFETSFGIRSSITVPEEEFVPKKVKSLIDSEVAKLEEIMKLSG